MKKAYLLLLAGMLSTAVFAGSKQTIKIDGQVIEKTVSEITFDGDNVVLQYSDSTSDQADIILVSLRRLQVFSLLLMLILRARILLLSPSVSSVR